MDAHVLEEKLVELREKLDEDFVKEVKTADPVKLKEMVFQLSKKLEDQEAEKAADTKLRTLKSQVSDLNAGYRDAKKPIANKLKYTLLTLTERGVV